jgi:hypothetical protein
VTKRPIPFPFAPIPRAAFTGLRNRELTVTEWRVLMCLYERVQRVSWTTRLRDLDSLAQLVCWEGKLDTLSKALRSLRSQGWIDYESRPGSTRRGYSIRLLGPPELGPSRNCCKAKDPDKSDAPTGPSKEPFGPSTEEAASTLHDRDRGSQQAEPVRAALNGLREKDALRRSEDQVLGRETSRAGARVSDPSFTAEEEAEIDRLWDETAPRMNKPDWA